MSRWRAAGLHLAMSCAVLASAAGLMAALWYPPSLFHVAGADRLLLVLAIIDVSIGPLLTLLVYRAGKPGLRFDLAVIALLQLAFFAYGARICFDGRPVFLVGAIDRFELVFANQLAPADLARAHPPFDRLGYGRPRLAGLVLPSDEFERSALVVAEMSGHPAALQPRYYQDFASVAPSMLRHAQPLLPLWHSAPDAPRKLGAALRRLRLPATAVVWMPLDSSRGSAVQLLAADDGRLLATVALDPWIPARTTPPQATRIVSK